MHFSAVALLALPIAAYAVPVVDSLVLEKRGDVSGVTANLNQLLTDTNTLTASLNAISTSGTATTSQLQAVGTNSNTFAADVNTTLATVAASSAFSAAQTTTIYGILNKKLLGPVCTAMQAFVTKEPAVARYLFADVVPTVHDALAAESTYVTKLFKAIQAKGAGPSLTKLAPLSKKFTACFTSAVNAYTE